MQQTRLLKVIDAVLYLSRVIFYCIYAWRKFNPIQFINSSPFHYWLNNEWSVIPAKSNIKEQKFLKIRYSLQT